MTDWGNTLTAGLVEAACLFEDREEEVLTAEGGAAQIVRRIMATIRTSDFPTLVQNDPVEVDGVAYTVFETLQLGDGALTELRLRLAETS